MSDPNTIIIHTDGASRGNPGPAAYAYVLQREGAEDIEEKGCLAETTNNIAEYTALLKALEHARQLGGQKLKIYTDSELMVKQLEGSYRVKNENLRPLYEQILDLWEQFTQVAIQHVRREQNSRADRLCNEALDAAKKPAATKAKAAPAKPAKATADVHENAIDCLRSVAAAWARGNPNDPKPEQVWEQLWAILEEAGAVRRG